MAAGVIMWDGERLEDGDGGGGRFEGNAEVLKRR